MHGVYIVRIFNQVLIYHRTSQDDMGRIYPTTFAAQALPRSLRLVLFASTHSEIDMWGAHYEIVRRFGPPMI